jgi:N-methylhydantoinase A/oxoprolinase/acetone carboxylase beta subunit
MADGASIASEREGPADVRIGIDVGGTNTDAVLMRGREVVAETKTPTTPDVTAGIERCLSDLVAGAEFRPEDVQAVMIGTTHFVNAIVEARRLMPTAAVRLGLPATAALPPMVDWPARLRDALGNHVFLCQGGHEFDGRELAPLDEVQLKNVARQIGDLGVRSIAISSVFSPVNGEFEQRAADILRAEVPDAAVSLSHEIGRMGLLERENATIMNACLRDLAEAIVHAFGSALATFEIGAPVYLSQNDGTLMDVDFAEKYPVATFASGPTNSMRGAAFLSGLSDCAVVDIGGTTSDVGILQKGFPREASTAIEISGIRTNFRMPDVFSFGLGGGSLVSLDGELSLGPESVGYELTTRSRVFGGDDLTATDLAVAAGLADLGDRHGVSDLRDRVVKEGLALIGRLVSEAVDRMRTSAHPIPVVIVGGGSILVGDRLPAASNVIKPHHFAVANAIGAAIAQVGGEVERVFSLDQMRRDQAVSQAKSEAVAMAVEAGADESTVEIVDVDEVPLAYLPSNATRIRVKAVGDLSIEEEQHAPSR